MPNGAASLPARRWGIVLDGDNTLWACSEYYIAAGNVCVNILRTIFGPAMPSEDVIRDQCYKIQRQFLRRRGNYENVYPDSWVATYHWLCRELRQPWDELCRNWIFSAASSIKLAPFSIFPGVHDTLQTLVEEGHHLYLLTHGDSRWQNKKVDVNELRQHFQRVLVTPWSKGPKLYRLSKQYSHLMMVGDNYHADLHPCQAHPIVRVLVDSSDPWVQPNQPLGEDIHRLGSVNELPDLIRTFNTSRADSD